MDKIAEIVADMDAARERFEDNVLDSLWKKRGIYPVYDEAHSYMQTAQDRFDALRAEVERIEQSLVTCHAESVERWRLLLEASTDAKRYRWLRESRTDPQRSVFLDAESTIQLDAAIDAAMQGDA